MKILFAGPLLDMSGFATASRHFLQAISHNNENVAARAITYDKRDNANQFVLPAWLKILLDKPMENIDMLIQMTTPNEAVPCPGVCNGLYTFLESDRTSAQWRDKANQFDFILVPCKPNAEAMVRSGVIVPILVCPPPCDKDIYLKEYTPLKIPNVGNRTVFYNICQLSAKKGIDSLVRAYYAAFADIPDDVLLVLKTYVNMQDRSRDGDIVKQFIERVRLGCHIPVNKYPPIMPIIQTMSDDEIHGLHLAGHAYVCSSRAEGWCYPAFDALGHGKTLITNNYGGLGGFVTPENSLLYGGCMTNFYDVGHPDPSLFTGVEQCFEPSTAEMAHIMRAYHMLRVGNNNFALNEHNQNEWNRVETARNNGRLVSEKFDYRNSGSKIVEHLESGYRHWQINKKVEFAIGQS